MNCCICNKQVLSGHFTEDKKVICNVCKTKTTRRNKFDCKHAIRAGVLIVFVTDDCKHPKKKNGMVVRQECLGCKLYDGR